MSVGALERRFYALFVAGLGLSADDLPPQMDRAGWPELRRVFTTAFKTRTRDEWTAIFRDVDACVYPVLSLGEVAYHPLTRERHGFVTVDGIAQPASAPASGGHLRPSRRMRPSPGSTPAVPCSTGASPPRRSTRWRTRASSSTRDRLAAAAIPRQR